MQTRIARSSLLPLPVLVPALLAMTAGLAAGQDSVSRNFNGGNGLPGDALSPWATASQRTNYVVDLAPLQTSWGTQFGIGPIMKSGRTSTARFTALSGASAISPDIRTGLTAPSASYTTWTQAGGGISSAENNTALNTSIPGPSSVSVFGVGFMDFDDIFAGTTATFVNQVYGAQIAFDPAQPDRMFVTRVLAASNNPNATGADRSQLGFGSIDANGNVVFRADGFGVASSTNPLTGDSLFRVRTPARLSGVNTIDNLGGSDSLATDWVLNRSAMTHATPTAIPASIAGRNVVQAADFAGQYKFEQSANTLANSAAHLGTGVLGHRGSASFSASQIFAGTVGTNAVLARGPAGAGRVESIAVWGVSSDGQVAATRSLPLPASLTDACTGAAWSLAGGAFRHYDSQVTFRGGVGPVAVGRDAMGNGLAAATLSAGVTADPTNPANALVAARFDPSNPNQPASWSIVAWVEPGTLNGKPILGDYGVDGAPGTNDAGEGDGLVNGQDASIGRLAAMNETGFGLEGPSISSPTFDSAGNAYFIASVLLNRRSGPSIVQDSDIVLVRAIYDPSTFCYRLDLMLRLGSTFAGRNSAKNYRVSSLQLADGDSVASGSLWSASATQLPWNGQDASSLPTDAPQHLGGLVISGRIVYDVNGDGQYDDITLPGTNSLSVDEAYNAVLFISNLTPPLAGCVTDYNQDGGGDTSDIIDLANDIASGTQSFPGSNPDFNQDGGADTSDVIDLANTIAGGPCP